MKPCEVCGEQLPRGNSDGLHAQCQRSFCSCAKPDADRFGQCDECGKPVYKAMAETPQMREAVEERGWAGPWAWHER